MFDFLPDSSEWSIVKRPPSFGASICLAPLGRKACKSSPDSYPGREYSHPPYHASQLPAASTKVGQQVVGLKTNNDNQAEDQQRQPIVPAGRQVLPLK